MFQAFRPSSVTYGRGEAVHSEREKRFDAEWTAGAWSRRHPVVARIPEGALSSESPEKGIRSVGQKLHRRDSPRRSGSAAE